MSNFNKNAILTGRLDAFCLPCGTTLRTWNDIEDHIRTPEHDEKLKGTKYLEKYEDDHIRKVNGGYYCEFCNVLLATTAKVSLHITLNDHKNNKGYQYLERVEEGIVFYNEVLIDHKSWHGLIEGSCCLCDEDVECELDHMNLAAHIVKLIQTDIQMRSSSVIYRKVDTSIHCLICNSVYVEENMTSHLESSEHMEHYQLRRTHKRDLNIKKCFIITDTKENNGQMLPIEDNRHDRENTSSNVEIKNNEDSFQTLAAEESASEIARKNNIIYKFGQQHAYCTVCNVTISSTITRIDEHVKEPGHVEELNKTVELINKQPKKDFTKTMFEYIDEIVLIDTFLLIINKTILLPKASFDMITEYKNIHMCQACEIIIELQIFHILTEQHMNALKNTPVLAELEGEFVREVRPGVYHCGFCNIITKNRKVLSKHLLSDSHIKEKQEASFICKLFQRLCV